MTLLQLHRIALCFLLSVVLATTIGNRNNLVVGFTFPHPPFLIKHGQSSNDHPPIIKSSSSSSLLSTSASESSPIPFPELKRATATATATATNTQTKTPIENPFPSIYIPTEEEFDQLEAQAELFKKQRVSEEQQLAQQVQQRQQVRISQRSKTEDAKYKASTKTVTSTATSTATATATSTAQAQAQASPPPIEQPIIIQGNSLRSYSFDSTVNNVRINLSTPANRPLQASVDLWHGPDSTPQTLNVYMEDGNRRNCVFWVLTPGCSNSIAVRNVGPMQFPIMSSASVGGDVTVNLDVGGDHDIRRYGENHRQHQHQHYHQGGDNDWDNPNGNGHNEGGLINNHQDQPLSSSSTSSSSSSPFGKTQQKTLQGGAIYTIPFNRQVAKVKVSISTEGCPLNAVVELLQGPNNNKQVMEVSAEDGGVRPFYTVIDTPGAGNVVRVINSSPVEFPLNVSIEPYEEKLEKMGGYGWT